MTNDFDALNNVNFQISIVPVDPIYLPHSDEYNREIILLDVSCENYFSVLNTSEEFLHYAHWFIYNSIDLKVMNDDFYHNFAIVNALVDSEITMFFMSNVTENVYVKQIYKTAIQEDTIIEDIGLFENENFIDSRSSLITSRRRQNLQSIRLKASMVVTGNDTLDHLTDYR